jgi:hypothetical protein
MNLEGLILKRDVKPGTYPLAYIVYGLTNSPAVKTLFPDGEKLEEILNSTMVTVVEGKGYMRVDSDGTILVAEEHLSSSDERVIYLDFVHELVHVKQAREGRTLFDRSIRYVDKDTEIEAYSIKIAEGRRIGMGEDELGDYLEVPWITEEEFERFKKKLGVAASKS